MMKKLLMIAVATAAILPMAAQADPTATGTINLSANAPPTCQIRGISAAKGTTGLTDSDTGVSLDFGAEAVNATSASVEKATSKTLTLDAFCNYAKHNVSLMSENGGLINEAITEAEGTFHRRIGYTAHVKDWASTDKVANLTTTGDASTTGHSRDKASSEIKSAVNKSNASIVIETVTGDKGVPLLEGSYSDILTIRLGGGF